MKLASEILLSERSDLLNGRKIGILAHAASCDSSGKHIVKRMINEAKAGNWQVTALFGPEHGLDGLAQDMEVVECQMPNAKCQISTFSLYGDSFSSLSPTPEMLSNIDVLVIDLQDVGSRYYTYANTMALCMRACQSKGVDVIVCDRPNPINGVDKEGGTVEPDFRSFVGMYPFPVRHAMTIGEIAGYVMKEDRSCRACSAIFGKASSATTTIIPMQGWDRKWFWDQTGLKWINPSPNMRSLLAALLYPGMCLLEGTNVSEGRGTRMPFEVCGSPWIDGEELAKEMRGLKLKGIDFDPVVFTPTSRKFEGERCSGVQFIVTDRKIFKPYLTGLSLIHTLAKLYRKKFKWRREPYEFVTDIPAIDLLTGNGKFRKFVDKGFSLEKVLEEICKIN